MVHRFLLSAAAGFALWGIVPNALAYCRTTTCAVPNPPAHCGSARERRDPVTQCLTRGEPLFWEQGCVSFSVHRTGSDAIDLDYADAEAIVARAFAAWPNVQCGGGSPSIDATSLGPIECERREFNVSGPNANAVLFRDADWPHSSDAIALTTVSFETDSGRILGADMEINTAGYPLTPATLEYVVVHEAGHFFGIDHSPESSAIMYYNYSLSSADTQGEPALTEDDEAAICAIYPPDREALACEPEPERGFATDCGGNVVGSCRIQGAGHPPGALVGLGFGVALAAARRRRRGATACAPEHPRSF